MCVEETLKTMSHPPQREEMKSLREGVRRGRKSVTIEEVCPDTARWRDDGGLITCRDTHKVCTPKHTSGQDWNNFSSVI